MHDTFLLDKISKSLNAISKEGKLQSIEGFTLVVNHKSHINEENLREHLMIHNKHLVGNRFEVQIEREEIEDQTAIIKSIQGEIFEK